MRHRYLRIGSYSGFFRYTMPFNVNYIIEIDPEHLVLRVTWGKVLTEPGFLVAYEEVSRIARAGGPFSGIVDFSAVEKLEVSTEFVRGLASREPAIPAGTVRVAVAPSPVIFGLGRMFFSLRHGMNNEAHVVRSLDAAYALLGFPSLNFSKILNQTRGAQGAT
jgi:hypothetical protein